MPRGKSFTEEEVGRIMSYNDAGLSNREIARRIGRSHEGVANVIRMGSNYGLTKRPGRPSLLSERQLREITRKAGIHHLSSSDIKKDLGLSVTTRRVRQILHSAENISWVKCESKPALKTNHKIARLQYANEHLLWDHEWRNVVFSDEKKFTLDGPDGYSKMWNDKRLPAKVRLHRNFGGGNLMVWAGFCYTRRSPICFVTNKMNSQNYIELLENVLIPYLDETELQNPIFQQDNASIHKARVVSEWLNDKNIETMKWPALSPDLNPIENIWGILSNKVYARGRQFNSLRELKDEVIRAWNEIDLSEFKNLVNSMPRRMEEVIRKSGGHTHY